MLLALLKCQATYTYSTILCDTGLLCCCPKILISSLNIVERRTLILSSPLHLLKVPSLLYFNLSFLPAAFAPKYILIGSNYKGICCKHNCITEEKKIIKIIVFVSN